MEQSQQAQPLIVQAEYSFKGGNNDELCFKKGDLITVTQREDGGWWEGTLSEKTGWFPSNYVNEYKAPLPVTEATRPPEEIQEYRSVVLKDLLDSERAHVAEIQGLLENFLEPLQQTQILSESEYAQLMCNFVDVVKTHDELLVQMEECNDRVGKLFLTKAPTIKQVHQAYCATHPKAVVILDKHKDELEKYMERQGAAMPGLLVLTTGLSKPFRRLDKYSAMLQELERHMESSHPDRGDTQRSVAVYKDIAATCTATRRQKELELQVLTGPVRGWQGQELSSLGDIIHMGSVAVGSDHRDRYFVLFPQTLIILSVSQRMSAFIYEGKLPLAGISVCRLEDSDAVKNAFEISGPLAERIVAVCQGPSEANKWVELLSLSNPANASMPIGIKRQLSNLSNSSIGTAHAPQPPAHMSPPTANHGQLNQSQMQRVNAPQPQSMVMGTAAAGVLLSPPPQHKRSLSFNHHLSYSQYTHTPHPPHHHPAHQALLHHPPQPQSLPSHPLAAPVGHKSSLIHTSNSISKTAATAAPPAAGMPSARTAANTKANWCISNLRPAPPLRPCLLNGSAHAGGLHGGASSGSGGGGVGTGGASGSTSGVGGSASGGNALASYCSGRKNQPTFEEDALVLRVFEAYCAAYQSNARNTIHSALQPWTPCLPIRGGKLIASKPFSTSNPQLPFLCNMGAPQPHAGAGGPPYQPQPASSSSLNSSYIWREASPNSFNLYSSSVSSLNMGGSGYRHSLTAGAANAPLYHRALSEERATRKSLNRLKSGFGSGYDNICTTTTTPLLPRKAKPAAVKLTKNASLNVQQAQRSGPAAVRHYSSAQERSTTPRPGLYDRRLNRSFETASQQNRYAGYGGGYMMGCGGLKVNALRRSTPQLAAGDDSDEATDCATATAAGHSGCGAALLGGGPSAGSGKPANGHHRHEDSLDSQRHSGSWCCGLENEDMTPTLRQLWTSIRQMQQDLSQMKLQINEERALRVDLQHLLMQHLEAGSTTSSSTHNTPKC